MRLSGTMKGALAASLMMGVAACGAAGQQQKGAPPPPPVTVSAPSVESVDVWEEVTGRFKAIESVEVRPQITGRILQAHFVEGQVVRRGDVLFTIDAGVQRAQAAQARAQLDLAKTNLARAERLRAADAISTEEYEQRRQDLSRLQAALAEAQVSVDYAAVRSPVSGRISDRRVDPGNVVVADQTVLTSVVSQSPIHFEFTLEPKVATALKRPTPGRADGPIVKVRLEGEEGFTHEGRIDFIDNQVDAKTGVIRARARFENADGRFTPGEFARLRITVDRLNNVTTVPETAIAADQTRRYVLVVAPGNVVAPHPVELGPLLDGKRVVRGLEPDARVVVEGAAKVFPGMPVTPQTPEQAAAAAKAQGGPPAAADSKQARD